VAPDSSDKNFKRAFFKPASWGCVVKPPKLRMAHLRLSEYDSLLLGKIRF
jgi:hypothetical protein